MKRGWRILFGAVRVAIGVGLLWYLGTSGAIEWRALIGLARVWPITLAAFLLLLLDMIVTSWRLCVLMAARGLHLSVTAATKLSLIGMFFSACLPGSTGGDLVKIYYATEGNRGRRMEVATVILFDRAVGMFGLMLWPLLVTPFFPRLIEQAPVLRVLLWGAAGIAAGLLIGFVAAWSESLRRSRLVQWMFRGLPLGSYVERIFDTVHGYRNHLGAVLGSVAISLLAHTMSVAVTLLLIAAVNPAGAAWQMAVLIPLGHLANTLPFTPGGLGVGEAAFNKLFSMAGLTGGAEGMLGWRLLTIAIGLLGLLFYLQGRRKVVHDTTESAAPLEGSISAAPPPMQQ
ncbi:MAG: lysylphosphatidylglycerol synthase transmembrane domain-containing protein [Candidatus Acidiferrales bacterium]